MEKRKLTAQQTIRGQVYPPVRYDVTPTAPSADVTALYVSKATVPVGARVDSGDHLGEVSGRPLFALRGNVPAYRDLKLGMTGSDVTQLQRALRDLGYWARFRRRGNSRVRHNQVGRRVLPGPVLRFSRGIQRIKGQRIGDHSKPWAIESVLEPNHTGG